MNKSLEQSKYTKWYFQIIENRKHNPPTGYCETHHIIPRSLGGSNVDENLVKLTAREHFVVHLLLTKMFPSDINKTAKMVRAWCWMAWNKSDGREYKINSRIFEKLRKQFRHIASLSRSNNNSQFGTKWVHNPITMQSKKIKKEEVLLDGWCEGRVINWGKFKLITEKKLEKHTNCIQCDKMLNNSQTMFCSSKCCNKHHYVNAKHIKIQKQGIIKEIKPHNFPAHKKIGWILVDT